MTVKGKYGGRKVRDGTVVSDKMEKTLLVSVEEHIRHPLYKKRVRRQRKFMAHDERGEGRMGDRVRIVEAAPISRRKRWKLVEILERAELPDVAPESIDLDLLGEVKREEPEAVESVATTVAAVEPEAVEEPDPAEEPAPEPVAEEAAVEDVASEESVAAEEDAPVDEAEVAEEDAPEDEADAETEQAETANASDEPEPEEAKE